VNLSWPINPGDIIVDEDSAQLVVSATAPFESDEDWIVQVIPSNRWCQIVTVVSAEEIYENWWIYEEFAHDGDPAYRTVARFL
jgi:hypothetical protein